ncbi:MAG TPA: DUF3472 domain-containing protein [Candidatus Saccharimonadales bacterium]|nr:DUF3472 domain-containing protein [Candidatus Saccharimonadales bacterium]
MKALMPSSRKVLYFAVSLVVTVMITNVVRQSRVIAASPSGTYSDNYFPSPPAAGYTNVEHDLKVNYVTTRATYFWAHQINFASSGGKGGGYFGMQSGSSSTQDRVVLFALWDTTRAKGTSCSPFGNEGVGMHCGVSYNWVSGRTYHFRLAKLSQDANGIWWRATVKDTVTGAITIIGDIENPPGWGGLGTFSGMWTEYFAGSVPTCNDLPYSNAEITNVRMNDTVKATTIYNHKSATDCTNSKITTITSGVREEMGNRPGDITGDDKINIYDLNRFAKNFNKTSATLSMGDLNNDKTVNSADLTILTSYYGK